MYQAGAVRTGIVEFMVDTGMAEAEATALSQTIQASTALPCPLSQMATISRSSFAPIEGHSLSTTRPTGSG